ncbi:hypothetical protein [Natronosalvus amylolyticus]|uniref:hypothetical protein n=1 Tax=Natronosalvus amylolyticus TaxID=2961994 RepID=UPI0020C9F37D|nr:hypothetical protein [Natronosalvus amylolyticus]
MQGTQVEDEGKNEREESERAIESTLEELTDEVTTETELVPGEPARTILQYADDTWSTFGRVLVSIGEWRKGGPRSPGRWEPSPSYFLLRGEGPSGGSYRSSAWRFQ